MSSDLNNQAILGSDSLIYVPPSAGGDGTTDVQVSDSPPTNPDVVLWVSPNEGGDYGITHDNLAGLGDDDHPIYFNQARGDARYVLRAGDSLTGDLGVVKASGDSTLSVSGQAGTTRSLQVRTSGNARWSLTAGSTAETGSEAGSNLALTYHYDTGIVAGTALAGSRQTGLLTVKGDPTANLGISTKQYTDSKVVDSSAGVQTTVAMSVNATKAYVTSVANAKVTNTVVGSQTDVAPSVAATSAALAGKASLAGATFTGTVYSPNLQADNGANSAYVTISGAAGQYRGLNLRTLTQARWLITADNAAESGSNAGSDLVVRAYNDASTSLGDRLKIRRSDGLSTFGGNVEVSKSNAVITAKSSAGDALLIADGPAATSRKVQFSTDGTARWRVGAGNQTESGSNAGSSFDISRYSDAGAYVDTPFSIDRATGKVTIKSLVVSTSPASGTYPAGTVWVQY